MIQRQLVRDIVQQALPRLRAALLVGPRQVGKTTLARQLLPASHPNYFDLEDPVAR